MWYFGENDSWNLLVTTIECEPVGDSSWYDTRGSCGGKPQSLVTDVFYPCFCPAFKASDTLLFTLFVSSTTKYTSRQIHKQLVWQAADTIRGSVVVGTTSTSNCWLSNPQYVALPCSLLTLLAIFVAWRRNPKLEVAINKDWNASAFTDGNPQ